MFFAHTCANNWKSLTAESGLEGTLKSACTSEHEIVIKSDQMFQVVVNGQES